MKKGLSQYAEESAKLPSREKYWSELTDSEKIERLREYAQRVEYLTQRINELEVLFDNHEHLNGRIVRSAVSGQTTPSRYGSNPNCWGCEECRKNTRI